MQIRSFADVDTVLAKHIPPARAMRSNYKLDTMRALMRHLGNPQDSYKVVHVAGTSGKTSTAYFIASHLHQAGKKVGLTVSPHVDTVAERVQINLEPLSEQKYCEAFSQFVELISKSDVTPTYFELLVAFAYWKFAQEKVDYAVIEVGLGGLLDGTNVVTRSDKVAVLTDIGLDHVDILGNDIAEIAAQKAGIILPDSQAFCLEQDQDILDVFAESARKVGAQLAVLTQKEDTVARSLPLYQQRNWSLANQVSAYVLDQDGVDILDPRQLEATVHTYIPARMETIQQGGTTLILDAAHNPQKMQALCDSLKQQYPGQKFDVLLALLRSKDMRVQGVLNELLPIASNLIVTDFVAGQDLRKFSTPPEQLIEAAQQMGFTNVEVIHDTKRAYNVLMKLPGLHKLATGSFYLLHDMHMLATSQKGNKEGI